MIRHARTWSLVCLAAAATVVLAAGCGAPAGKTSQETTAGPKPETAWANAVCPMMGSPIDLKKVTPELVRVFEGKKVAFCCGGCPAAWDKLSEAQKRAKLRQASGEK